MRMLCDDDGKRDLEEDGGGDDNDDEVEVERNRARSSVGVWATNEVAVSPLVLMLLLWFPADGRLDEGGDISESWLSGPLGVRDGAGGLFSPPGADLSSPKCTLLGPGVRGKNPELTR